MRIGDLSARTGMSVRALRYYEEQELLPSDRSASGQRHYDDTAVDRVRLLQIFYRAGLSSTSIRLLLPSVEAGTAAPEAIEHLLDQREALESRLRELEAAASRLDEVITAATDPLQRCRHPPTAPLEQHSTGSTTTARDRRPSP
nr:MerR family transcriptional regulator [uncultured Pseudokineococcus sp.]